MSKLVIGVAGGSGSGKTTVARKISQGLETESYVLLPQDAYYKDGSHLSMEERRKINYDHPFAFDNDLLISHIEDLKQDRPIRIPKYSFITYTREGFGEEISPAGVIIVEGILVLEDPKIRERLDIKVFVDTEADERFIRRLKRDIFERGRQVDNIIRQYTQVVRPMHIQFVEPTKRFADIIVPQGGDNWVAIDVLISTIKAKLAGIG